MDTDLDPNLDARQPHIGDAWGRVLARCWDAGAAPWSGVEVIERDDGMIEAHDASRYFAEPQDWSELERWGWEQAAGRILDVGCGGGRHAVPWLALGREVVGLEPSPEAVRVSRERGVEAVIGSVPTLPEGLGVFDTIALFGNNLGLLGGPAQAPEVLAALASVARPGARLIGKGMDPVEGGGAHAEYHAWNLRRGRPAGSCASGCGTARRRRRGSTIGSLRRTKSPPSSPSRCGPWRPWSATRPAPATSPACATEYLCLDAGPVVGGHDRCSPTTGLGQG